jgi:RNA polymerase sigma-70 factor (ECF subfamily)
VRALGEDRAKDVTQEVFVNAWRSRDRFDPAKGSLGAWLMGIAKFRILDNLRAEKRHSSRRADAEVAERTAAMSTGDDVEALSDRMLVADALRALPERSRTVIELAYFGDLTHAQVADHTSLPLGTVKSDIRRGLALIRSHLESANV